MVPTTIRLLIFSSGGRRYGVDAEIVAGLAASKDDAGAVRFDWLVDGKGQDGGAKEKRLFVKQRKNAVVIPEPETLAECETAELQSPPALLKTARRQGVWGFWLREGEIITLIDFYKNERFQGLFDPARRQAGAQGTGEGSDEQ